MGQFLRLGEKPVPAAGRPVQPFRPKPTMYAPPSPSPAAPAIAAPQPRPAMVQQFGIFLLSVFLIAPAINELTLRIAKITLNIGLIFGVGAMIALLASGSMMRFLQSTVGKVALGFLLLLAFGIPTSHWAADSFGIWSTYASRTFICVLFIPAFVLSLGQMKTFLNFYVVGFCVFLLTCVLFASPHPDHGRLVINGSPFYENPNDLGIQLVFAIPFLFYRFGESGFAMKLVTGCGLGLSLWFLLKTASRGAFVALVVLFLVQLVVSKQRMLIGAVAVVGFVLFIIVPSDAQRRLFVVVSSSASAAEDRGQGGIGEAVASSAHRQHLLTRALEMTVRNPIFGIGLGQFPNVIWSEGKAVGVHESALGTHNSYLQVSSETGIPAFICYVAMILMSVRRSLWVYKIASKVPELKELAAQSFCWFSASVSYLVFSTFHHIGYSNLLPVLCGATIAMELLSRPLLQPYLRSFQPTGPMGRPVAAPVPAIASL